jgi:hypothetical protein
MTFTKVWWRIIEKLSLHVKEYGHSALYIFLGIILYPNFNLIQFKYQEKFGRIFYASEL